MSTIDFGTNYRNLKLEEFNKKLKIDFHDVKVNKGTRLTITVNITVDSNFTKSFLLEGIEYKVKTKEVKK